MSLPRRILVVGATGKQGRAVIEHLSSSKSTASTPSFEILALTRKPDSPSAQSLKSLSSSINLVQGDLDDVNSVRKVFGDRGGKESIWGVFCALQFPGLGANADAEEQQGMNLANLALEYGVSHFVFSSLERGGESYDDHLVLDRLAKVRIERHIISLGDRGLRWTLLRPGFFMENFDGTIGKITVAVLKAGLHSRTEVPLVAVDDIGRVACSVFERPEESAKTKIAIVSDFLTTTEMESSYQQGAGTPLPSYPLFAARLLILLNEHTKNLIGDMNRIHTTVEEHAGGWSDFLAESLAFHPKMTSFEEWARRRKGKSAERGDKWNNVSILDLIRGNR